MLNTNYGLVIALPETVEGENEVQKALVANTDILYQRCQQPTVEPVGVYERPANVRPTHDVSPHVYIPQGGTVNVTGYFGEPASATEPPDWRPFLLASNFTETIGADRVTYNLVTRAQQSLSMASYRTDSKSELERIQNSRRVRGNWELNFSAETLPTWTFSGSGLEHSVLSAPADYFDSNLIPLLDTNGDAITYTGAVSYSEQVERQGVLTCTFNGVVFQLGEFSFTCGWTVTPIVSSGSGETTYCDILLSRGPDSPPQGSMTLKCGAEALTTALEAFPAGTTAEMVFTMVIGARTVTITLPQAQLGTPTEGDEGGFAAWTIPFFATIDSFEGDNSVVLEFS